MIIKNRRQTVMKNHALHLLHKTPHKRVCVAMICSQMPKLLHPYHIEMKNNRNPFNKSLRMEPLCPCTNWATSSSNWLHNWMRETPCTLDVNRNLLSRTLLFSQRLHRPRGDHNRSVQFGQRLDQEISQGHVVGQVNAIVRQTLLANQGSNRTADFCNCVQLFNSRRLATVAKTALKEQFW